MDMNFDRWIGLVGLILAFVSLALTWYFYVKGKREKRPYWRISSYNIIEDNTVSLTGLDVTYIGKKVNSLTISKIQIWNDGEETIRLEDLRTANPLRICAEDGIDILSVRVIEENSTSSEFSCRLRETTNDAIIEFAYLDPGYGAIIEVIHNGTHSSDLKIIGDVIGVKQVVNANEVSRKNITLFQKLFRVVFLMLLCFIAYHLLFVMAPDVAAELGNPFAALGSILLLIILAVGTSSLMDTVFKFVSKFFSPILGRYFPHMQRNILRTALSTLFEKRPKGLQSDDQ